jgi:exonuclease III
MDSEGIDILAIQESWEGQYVISNLQGYRWYGRPRDDKRGGVGFYIHASLANSIQIFRHTSLGDSIWVKVKGKGNTTAMCIGCVYMPDSSKPAAQRKAAFEALQTDLEFFKRKGEVVLCGDFNARVGKGNSVHEHIVMYG